MPGKMPTGLTNLLMRQARNRSTAHEKNALDPKLIDMPS
jgi:hypothetical protein